MPRASPSSAGHRASRSRWRDAAGTGGRVLAKSPPDRRVVLDKAAAGRHLFDVTRQGVGVVATAAAGVLLDAMAFAIVHEPRLAGGIRRRILPGGEPSLGVVGQQRAGRTTARA